MLRNRIDAFFDAIKTRDTMEIGNFLHESKAIHTILSNGEYFTDNMEFLSRYDEWFSYDDWSLSHEVIEFEENKEKGTCLAKITYRGADDTGLPFKKQLFMHLVFEYIEDNWYLVEDQNTLIKK